MKRILIMMICGLWTVCVKAQEVPLLQNVFAHESMSLNGDWNYGGITRDVLLVRVPPVYIEDYNLQLQRGNNGSKGADNIAFSLKLNQKILRQG